VPFPTLQWPSATLDLEARARANRSPGSHVGLHERGELVPRASRSIRPDGHSSTTPAITAVSFEQDQLAYDRFSRCRPEHHQESRAGKLPSLRAICPRRELFRADGVGSKRLSLRPEIPSIETTADAVLQAFRETGATGLEPATSGVTGRFEGYDGWRRWTRYRSIHAAFRLSASRVRRFYVVKGSLGVSRRRR
jgi:hypothetical protein